MKNSKTQQLNLKPRNKKALEIKSPIFTPKPGWGGKSKKWLTTHFESKVLPTASFVSIAIGVYLFFK